MRRRLSFHARPFGLGTACHYGPAGRGQAVLCFSTRSGPAWRWAEEQFHNYQVSLGSKIKILFMFAERVRRGCTRGKPETPPARTLEAAGYRILNDQDPKK